MVYWYAGGCALFGYIWWGGVDNGPELHPCSQVRCTTTLLRYDFVLLLYLSISKARLSLSRLSYVWCVFFVVVAVVVICLFYTMPAFWICQTTLGTYHHRIYIHNEFDHKIIHNGFADRGVYAMPFAPCHRL